MDAYAAARKRLGLPSDGRGNELLEYIAGLDGLNQLQLDTFIKRVIAKYETKRIEPGRFCC